MPLIIPLGHGSDKITSRLELLKWVNDLLSSDYKKIEQLHTGVAYCQLMDILAPGLVSMKKIKFNANAEHEFIHNFRIFQLAFTKSKVEKNVPIEKLIKGKFQDNFEFLQWFRKFYDLNKIENKNTKKPLISINGMEMDSSENNKKILAINMNNSNEVTSTCLTNLNKTEESSSKSPAKYPTGTELTNELCGINKIKAERDCYFNKLEEIKTLIQTGNYSNIVQEVNKIVGGTISTYESNLKKRRVSFNV